MEHSAGLELLLDQVTVPDISFLERVAMSNGLDEFVPV